MINPRRISGISSGSNCLELAQSIRGDFSVGIRDTAIHSLLTKSSSRFKAGNTIIGGLLTGTATLWMCFYSVTGMERQQSVSSSGCYERVPVSPDESSPTSCGVTVSLTAISSRIRPMTLPNTPIIEPSFPISITRVRERGMQRFKSNASDPTVSEYARCCL